jgi:hypothetical protein
MPIRGIGHHSRDDFMLRTVSVIALLLLPTAAFADRAKADLCAKDLTGEALNTYNFGISKVEANATLEQAVRPYLEPLHTSGKLTEPEARAAGEAAAKCMRFVHGTDGPTQPAAAAESPAAPAK